MTIHATKLAALSALCLGFTVSANAELVVIVSASNPQGSISAEKISEIYLGNDTSLSPVDLPESSPMREEFYSKATGRSATQAKMLWTRLIFTGKATAPKVADSPADVKSKVAANPKAIGYLDRGAVDDTVKVVYSMK